MPQETEHLTQADVRELRARLADEHRRASEDLQGLQRDVADENRPQTQGSGLSNVPTHPADVGTDTFQRDLAAQLLARQRAHLGEVEAAIARLEQGEYGRCAECNAPIGRERLMAKPWASFCIDHARENGR
jgi:RNA polymerase-binding transcription factor DksA